MAVRPFAIAAFLVASAQTVALHDAFDAAQAFAYTAQVAGFGERPPGSPGHQKTQDLIREVLKKNGATIESDDFTAKTPRGPIDVHNIIGKFNVTADPQQPILILAGHYDTLFKKGFIGANDGASSTAILLVVRRRAERPAEDEDADLARLDGPRGSDRGLRRRRRPLRQPASGAEAQGGRARRRASRASSCST